MQNVTLFFMKIQYCGGYVICVGQLWHFFFAFFTICGKVYAILHFSFLQTLFRAGIKCWATYQNRYYISTGILALLKRIFLSTCFVRVQVTKVLDQLKNTSRSFNKYLTKFGWWSLDKTFSIDCSRIINCSVQPNYRNFWTKNKQFKFFRI